MKLINWKKNRSTNKKIIIFIRIPYQSIFPFYFCQVHESLHGLYLDLVIERFNVTRLVGQSYIIDTKGFKASPPNLILRSRRLDGSPLIRLIFARVITFLRNFLHAPSFLLLSLPFEELVEKWFPFMDVEL